MTPPHLFYTPTGPSRTPYPFPGPLVGYTPQQLTHAYGADAVNFGTVKGDGSGETIAIIIAFDNPGFLNTTDPNYGTSDLAQFDKAFGLPDPPSLQIVNSSGGTTRPAPLDPSWSTELALDIEWSHAFAPKANILVVEASDAFSNSLLAAVNYARSVPAVSVISMSLGGLENPNDLFDDSTYTTPAGHQGITFLAATGDDGAPGGYPAYAPTVVAVGGTTLDLDGAGNVLSEIGWSGSGGGISVQQAQPSFQNGVVTQSSTFRTIPDVSLNADPDTGAAVYDSYDNGSTTPWDAVGGTSLATPCFAGIIAIANQGRAVNGLPTLDGANDVLPKFYSLAHSAGDFKDITAGNNGFQAGTGYDLVTGIGTPHVPQLIIDLGGTPITPPPPPPPPPPGGGPGTPGTLGGTVLVGADAGQPPVVKLVNVVTGAVIFQTTAFEPTFMGGVRVARADVNGDGVPDIIVAAGSGGGPRVKVIDGFTFHTIADFFAYDPSFTGGVYVAAADVNHDGHADIITGAGAGGGPHVEVFDGAALATGVPSVIRSFFAYSPAFRGGVSVAGGDVDGDGFADIVTGAGPGGGPQVAVYSGATGALLRGFFAYSISFTGGVYVAAGDINGDGKADIITGAGAGGGPHVEAFSGPTGRLLTSFMASPPAGQMSQFNPTTPPANTGVRVAALDLNNNGLLDIVAVGGPGVGPLVQVRNGTTGTQLTALDVFDPTDTLGVFVG
jgi:hypothetical protein